MTNDELRAEVEAHADVSHERRLLEAARRKKMAEAMEEYDRTVYHPARAALRETCAKTGNGHAKRFTHLGPLGHPWFHCGFCGYSWCEDK